VPFHIESILLNSDVFSERLVNMEYAADCYAECAGMAEIFQIWLEVTVEITVRIFNFGLRIGPIGITIVIGGTVGYYYTYYDYGWVRVVSGHTIEIGKTQYRLYGVTALKQGQTFRSASGERINGFTYCRDVLTAKIGLRKVRCETFSDLPDPFKRTVAICSVRIRFGCRREDLGRWMIRNGYALADRKYMEDHPIRKGKYRKILEKEEAFARKHRLGIHAGAFISEIEAKRVFEQKLELTGKIGELSFGSLDELEVAFGLERRGDRLFDVDGKLFGGVDVTDLANAAVEAV